MSDDLDQLEQEFLGQPGRAPSVVLALIDRLRKAERVVETVAPYHGTPEGFGPDEGCPICVAVYEWRQTFDQEERGADDGT